MTEAFAKCGKNKVNPNESLFKQLNDADHVDAQSALVVRAIDDLIESSKKQNLPSQNWLDLLNGMRQDLGEDIEMVVGFWAAKIDVMIKLGKKRFYVLKIIISQISGSKASEIEEELEAATQANPIPSSEFAKFKTQTLERIKEPEFDERQPTPDPEATIPLEDDEMLELSIVNRPPFEDDVFEAPTISVEAPTPEPPSTEQTLAKLTEINNKDDTLLRFVVNTNGIFKCSDGDYLFRFERQSSRTIPKLFSLQFDDQNESPREHLGALQREKLQKGTELQLPRYNVIVYSS